MKSFYKIYFLRASKMAMHNESTKKNRQYPSYENT